MSVYKKINEVMKKVETVYKDGSVGWGNNSYKAVTHDNVTQLLHKPITDSGLVVLPSCIKHEKGMFTGKTKNGEVEYHSSTVEVMVRFVDSEDDSFTEVLTHAFSFDNGDKAYGKAISYAVKYALLKVFMLESADDEESRDSQPEKIIHRGGTGNGTASKKQQDLLIKLTTERGQLTDERRQKIMAMSGQEASDNIAKLMGK